MEMSQGCPGCSSKSCNRWIASAVKVDKNSDAFGEVRLRFRQAQDI